MLLETAEYRCTVVCPSALNIMTVAAPLTVAVQNVALAVGSGFILKTKRTALFGCKKTSMQEHMSIRRYSYLYLLKELDALALIAQIPHFIHPTNLACTL